MGSEVGGCALVLLCGLDVAIVAEIGGDPVAC